MSRQPAPRPVTRTGLAATIALALVLAVWLAWVVWAAAGAYG